MESRPVSAYTLALVGAVLQAVAALFILIMTIFTSRFVTTWQELVPERFMPWMMGHWLTGYPFTTHPVWGAIWIASAVIVSALSFYGAIMMNSSKIGRVRTGATIVLIASIIALPTMWGLMIGSLLMFIGSILGLTWMPPAQPVQT
jgi:hypothetical protein